MNQLGQVFARLVSPEIVQPPIVEQCEKPAGESRSLAEWRQELVTSRADIYGKPGVYLDGSPTGTGKTYSDIEALRPNGVGLIVAPTHENAEEVEKAMTSAGLYAVKYPGRTTEGKNQNCWNNDADLAQKMGFNAVAAVCSMCRERSKCVKEGYLYEMESTRMANVAIATHARARFNGLEKLSAGQTSYIALHEDCTDVIAPQETAVASDIEAAVSVATEILSNPIYLDWLGQTAKQDEDGVWVEDSRVEQRRNRIDQFIRHLDNVVVTIKDQLRNATKTQPIKLPQPIPRAAGTETLLFRVSVDIQITFGPGTWRLLLAAADGSLSSIGVIVENDERPRKEGETKKHLIGVWKNLPSENATLVIADATTDAQAVEDLTGRSVVVITPAGHVDRSKRVVQYPRDITRRTQPGPFLTCIRGILTTFPVANRVGIISHSTHVGHLSKLEDHFKSRIKRSEYFGSGEDRASNSWFTECDLIAVIGTPRLPTIAVQQRLIQLGDFQSASESPDWGEVRWRGQTESGREIVVQNRGPRHPEWRRAHRSLVRANLIQAVGRGRPLLNTGCDVVLVSTEECGLPLAEDTEIKLTAIDQSVIEMLADYRRKSCTQEINGGNPLDIYKEKPPLATCHTSFPPLPELLETNEIAAQLDLSTRRVREILRGLENRRLIQRHGERGGWSLVTSASIAESTAAKSKVG